MRVSRLTSRFQFIGASPAFRRAWRKIDPISGWLVSPHQERWLFETVRRLPKDATIVEIGSFQGRSTVSMALACSGTARRIFAVDTFRGNNSDFVSGKNAIEWAGESFFDLFIANLESCGVRSCVEPMVGASTEIAREWKGPINMLFIDGSHDYEDVCADWEGFFPHVVTGGIVAIHDVTPGWEGPYRAWHQNFKRRLKRTGSVSTLAFGTKP